MRSIAILVALFISNLFNVQAQSPSETGRDVTVTIENIKGDSGSILVGLYSEKTFLKANPESSEEAKIVDGKATVIFKDLPEGDYAISSYHDKNGNSQMDFEPTGMPLEPYGISNNIINSYGAPRWEDAKFHVGDQAVNLSVRLNN